MKRTIILSLTVALLVTPLFAMWAMIPLEELVTESDLIIIGTLSSASEDDKGIGKGYIHVHEIVHGKAKTLANEPLRVGNRLTIEWADNWACASGMHMGRVGRSGVWLLEVEPNGTVSAAYPGRFETDAKSIARVRDLVRKKKRALAVTVDVATVAPLPELAFAETDSIVVDAGELPAAMARATLTFFLAFGLFFVLYRKRFGIG